MPPTHRDLYASFASHNVEYLVIGGIAAIIHGVPRMTLDLDILIAATPDNARATLQALRDAGMGTARLIEAEDLLAQDVTVFDDVLVVDVQIRTPGLVFEEAWERRRAETIEGVRVNVVSLDDLIASKEASDRPTDREALVALRRLRSGEC
jgi:predicted nucleotidyltransferase